MTDTDGKQMKTTSLVIGGMTCRACAVHVRQALASVSGVASVDVSLEEKRAVLELADGTGESALVEAVEAAGYTAEPESAMDEGAARLAEATFASDGEPAPGASGDGRHLLVIGGGSAAFAAAIRAAELGARVTMVERGVMGGTCVNRGCVPSKTLIRAAEVNHLRQHHPFAGMPSGDGAVDMEALVDQKRELVERLRGAKYRDVLAAYPEVQWLSGEARFTDAGGVEVVVPDGGARRLPAERVVIATGARPWRPELPGLEDLADGTVWTNEDALEAEEVPSRLVVAGGGPVGVELAQLFARLGSQVTLVAPELVPPADADLAEALAGHLRDEGLEIVTGARIDAVEGPDGGTGASGAARVRGEDGGSRRLPFDRLLLATGRTANTDALGVEGVGLETTGRGFLRVDDRLRTSRPGVFAAGDCTDRPHFVYVAGKAGTVAAENALGGDRRLDLSAMPAVVFTSPQLAWVGLTEREARERHGDAAVEVRTLPMAEVSRALANRDTRGRIKLVAGAEDGRLLGVHLLSPQAGEVIQTGVLAVKHGLTVHDLADTLFPYLTEVEGLKLAAQTFTKSVEKLSCCAG